MVFLFFIDDDTKDGETGMHIYIFYDTDGVNIKYAQKLKTISANVKCSM